MHFKNRTINVGIYILFIFVIATLDAACAYAGTYRSNDWGMWQTYNCKSVRTTVLLKQAYNNTVVMKGGNCAIQTGQFIDPYTNTILSYSDGIDIDHVVPRKWAWDHGAARWSKIKRIEFANDLINLIAVSDNINRVKGDKPPSRWLPPNKQFTCDYVRKFDIVVKLYKLNYDAKESVFINKTLKQCR